MAPCVQDTVKVEITAEKEGNAGYCVFSASGYSIKFDGFTKLYEDITADEDSDTNIPDVKAGDVLKLK